ncbi:helix-turn-helix transcriptional regulator [Marinobacterium sp. AK62]|uniref:Helix-turn-helix transcriptional regulator n=1 Tax=Marinobacterium alkalitolerans TaxID=1542925 RepID=A0ABS3ZAX8_9GAMM|nr:helix-turn-helix transcriptional regulator [Marinobacterium alkalitolerans]
MSPRRPAWSRPLLDHRDSKAQRETQSILKSYRKSKSYSQKELADALRVPQSFVSKYESGERLLTVTEVLIICSVLDRSLTDFATDLESRIL